MKQPLAFHNRLKIGNDLFAREISPHARCERSRMDRQASINSLKSKRERVNQREIENECCFSFSLRFRVCQTGDLHKNEISRCR